MTRPAHLLVVEDDENDVFFLKRALEKAEIQVPVTVVCDGKQAFDYLEGKGDYADRSAFPIPSLVLLDLKLPCVSGTEVLRWIRKESGCRWLPVIVLTSSTLTQDLEEAYACGANAYVVKPASPDLLTGMLRDFANWWLRHNIVPAGP